MSKKKGRQKTKGSKSAFAELSLTALLFGSTALFAGQPVQEQNSLGDQQNNSQNSSNSNKSKNKGKTKVIQIR